MSQISQQKNEVSGIILAAGLGRRIKTTKQLLSYAGRPLLQHVINAAGSSNLSKIILVLGFRAREIRNAVNLTGVETIINQFYEQGQGVSIRVGLTLVPDHHRAALFLLGDQPLITIQTINSILDRFQTSPARIIIPRFQGKRGNPVLVARPLFGKLYKLSGDSGGRELFQTHRDSIEYLDLEDAAILNDIDTQNDYARLIEKDKAR